MTRIFRQPADPDSWVVMVFVEAYRQEVIAALDHYLRLPPALPGTVEDLPRPSSQPFLDGLTGRLEQTLEKLLKAEKVHLNEVSNDAELRRRRDEAVDSLRQDIFQARELFRGAYSRLQTQRLGFESRIADDPGALLRQARRIESILSRPGDLGLTPYFGHGLKLAGVGVGVGLARYHGSDRVGRRESSKSRPQTAVEDGGRRNLDLRRRSELEINVFWSSDGGLNSKSTCFGVQTAV